MFEARRAGPADADGLMRLRGVMLGSMTGGPALTGDWQRTGAEMRLILDPGDPQSP